MAEQVRPRERHSACIHPRRDPRTPALVEPMSPSPPRRARETPGRVGVSARHADPAKILLPEPLRVARRPRRNLSTPRKRERDRLEIEVLAQQACLLEPPGDACG